MSLAAIRAALETALVAAAGSLPLSFENVPFSPVVGAAYGAVYLLPATPNNIEIGPGFVEQGLFQINLFYPLGEGVGAVIAKAEELRTNFATGSSFPLAGGGSVLIVRTPEIGSARVDDDRFIVPVKIRFESFQGG